MTRTIGDILRRYEGKTVRIVSTEGEIMTVKVLSVSDPYQDVIVDVLSTNQPERYTRLDRKYNEGSWAVPLEYIQAVEPGGPD
jgi:hypothetical protein